MAVTTIRSMCAGAVAIIVVGSLVEHSVGSLSGWLSPALFVLGVVVMFLSELRYSAKARSCP